MSFPEKIAALVRLQMMAAPIQRRRGRVVEPWRTAILATEDEGNGAFVLNETPARPPLPGDELTG